MKHLLPDLKDLIHTNFIVIKEDQWNEFSLNQSENLIFVQQSMQFFVFSSQSYAAAKKYQIPLREIPASHAAFVHMDAFWSTIGEKASQYHYLVVVRDKLPIGYIKTNELVSYILQAYTYLRAYNDAILKTTDSSISVVDEHLNTVVWTNGAERLFSIKKEDILGKPMTDFFPESHLDNIRTIKTGKGVYHKQHQPRDDLFVLLNSNPVKVNGKIVGVVSSEKDVTYQVQLNQRLHSANKTIKHLQEKVSLMDQSADPFHRIKGSSRAIRKTIDKVRQMGSIQARVLFQGESGVGKELFAKALHDMRALKNAPFIAINCGAIPNSLFESELFGYEKGAFSGASAYGKKGKFELAKGGTLFLDEIGELPLEMQVKLLRVLQEGTFYSVGGTKLKQADCFIITATNKDLGSLVKQGKFREDLFYRLNIVTITIPPLRDRIEDVIELSHQFIYEFSKKYDRGVKEIPKEIMMELVHYPWPGNIRELRNTIERLVIFSKDGRLNPADLPFNLQDKEKKRMMSHPLPAVQSQQELRSLEEAIKACEEKVIKETLERTNKNKNKAAEILGISRATLYNKMNKLGISY
ncbi:PAS domain-containing protein [Sporolactobacillus sp. THM7-7]|nr:PAS domain-containing protein [Sporolactobacillus sp. THM7-7]